MTSAHNTLSKGKKEEVHYLKLEDDAVDVFTKAMGGKTSCRVLSEAGHD